MSACRGASRPAGLLRIALSLIGSTRVRVTGRSMEPSLQEGDRLLIRRLWRRLGRIQRGHIVFLRSRGGDDPECIKRIVGLPYERIRIAAGRVYVGGRRVDEPYLAAGNASGQSIMERILAHEPEQEWRLGHDEYLVLGDNRPRSTDSRSYGPVRRNDIIGVAWYRYAPVGRRVNLVTCPPPSVQDGGGPLSPAGP